MPNVRYYLKSPDTTGESLISLYFSYNKKRLVYSTGQKVPPKFWNDEKQRVKESRKFPQYLELNAYLDNLTHETQNIYRYHLNSGTIPSTSQFKSKLDNYTLRSTTAGDTTLFGFIENLIKERESLPKFSKGIIQVYKRTEKLLKEYKKYEKIKQLDFIDIDLDFFAKFKNFLYTHIDEDNEQSTAQKVVKTAYAQNTAQKVVKTLKTFLNEATERG